MTILAKVAPACGNPSSIVSVRLALTLVAALLLAGVAHADPCPPAVAIEGEPTAAAAIRDRLRARGIAADSAACPGVRTRVERRGDLFVIGVVGADGIPVERVVGDPGTAATVIESFVRVDVGTPLLAARALPARATADDRTPPPAPSAAARTGAHVFASLDSSLGSDRTSGLGLQLGACLMLGPTCPAARFRFDVVVDGAGAWRDSTFRNSSELLVGIDVPLVAGRWLFLPGVAVGMGGVRTSDVPDGGGARIQRETTGLRGELHAALLVPVTTRVAVELSAAAVLLQGTEVDEGATAAVPRDPWGVLRLGLGVRYGAR